MKRAVESGQTVRVMARRRVDEAADKRVTASIRDFTGSKCYTPNEPKPFAWPPGQAGTRVQGFHLSDPKSIDSLVRKSLTLNETGDVSASLGCAREALDIARKMGDPAAIAEALVTLARARFHLGQYSIAKEHSTEALTLSPSNSATYIEARLRLGACASETGALLEAEEHYRHAVDLAREFGYPLLRLLVLHNLAAGIYIPQGKFDLALSADEEAYRIASGQDFAKESAYPLITIAWACLLTGRLRRAHTSLADLERLAPSGSAHQGYYLYLSAHLALDEGEPEKARSLCLQARSVAEATGESWVNIAVRLGMSRYHRLAGNAPAACAWAAEAVVFAARIGYLHEQGNALIERARAAWLNGDLAASETDLRAAAAILDKLGAVFDLSRARFLLAALLHSQGRAESAETWQQAAQAIAAGGYAFLLDQERQLAFPLVAAYFNHPDPALAAMSARLMRELQRVPPSQLCIVTLGKFEVWQGRGRIEKRALRHRRAGELLALLLLAPERSLSFDQVAEALWPERGPAAAQTAFHHATSALRHALEPELPDKFSSRYLEVEEGQVTLRLPPGSEVDVEKMEDFCRRGEWEAVLTIYGGDFLPNYLYADWTCAPRQRFSSLYQQASMAAAEARFAAKRFAEALDLCQRLLILEPWHEEAVLLGMRACAALNDLAGARRLYRALEETLHKDLNVTPQEELRTLYRFLTSPSHKLKP